MRAYPFKNFCVVFLSLARAKMYTCLGFYSIRALLASAYQINGHERWIPNSVDATGDAKIVQEL